MSELRRLDELIARQATEGLSGSEAMELQRLLAAEPGAGAEDFELAAAALDQALTPGEEPMPEAISRRIKQRVRRNLPPARYADPVAMPSPADRARGIPRTLPWLAAAAALVIAVIGWWPRAATLPEVAAAPGVEQLATLPDTLARPWTATEDPTAAGATGEVLWNGGAQRGVMRITGLAANDPGREQYQLWIFDRGRDERFPVDGGVFDVPAGSDEILVPIDAKLAVGEPYLFAITVEPPGGVVVSSRERIVLVAEV